LVHKPAVIRVAFRPSLSFRVVGNNHQGKEKGAKSVEQFSEDAIIAK
jgi:hypothetical protein